MKYLAVTQKTAAWLLGHNVVLTAVHDSLSLQEQMNALKSAEVVVGPLRMAGSPDGRLVAIWNVDYLSGTSEEDWGFIKLDHPLGIGCFEEVSAEVLERCLYVIDQRLRGLLIDSNYFHRPHENGTHTCLAGRGEVARQLSISYLEGEFRLSNYTIKTLVCIGPSRDFSELTQTADSQRALLPGFVQLSNQLISPQRRKPILDENAFARLRSAVSTEFGMASDDKIGITVPTKSFSHDPGDAYRTMGWTYDQWVAPKSPLSSTQRRILESDAVLQHPLRIVGPGGSGKSLLMQLLAIRRLKHAEAHNIPIRILYVVHNAAMARNLLERFQTLGVSEAQLAESNSQQIKVCTLSEYGREEIQLQEAAIIDVDAHETKLFQLGQVKEALTAILQKNLSSVHKSALLKQVAQHSGLFDVFVRLTMAEISTAIKGHGLTHDKQKYINSERHLSRLHGLLTQDERTIVFDAFTLYHHKVFEEYQVLDADDVALSLLGRLRTPIWELKRKTLGFDFLFVDETQLFNENERRLFPLLPKTASPYVPIVLALDEAQELYGQSTAGLGVLGIRSISNENLPSNHRSTKQIVELAFFVIQRTTDLFGPDFPDFTGAVSAMEPSTHPLAEKPSLEVCPKEAKSLARFVEKRIRELRRSNLRQIAIICHSDLYWSELEDHLSQADNINLQVLLQRGNRLPPNDPVVVLTRPAYVGGQEFDAVIAVGLEQGVVPPRIHDNDALASAVEQQALREMYLSFTRARYRLMVVINSDAAPTAIIAEAKKNGLID